MFARQARRLSTTARVFPRPVLVSLSNKTVQVGVPPRSLVSDLSLTMREGSRWAILGENGCGKTITAQLLGRMISGGGDDATALCTALKW